MKKLALVILAVMMISIFSGCEDGVQEIEYGDISIQYSDESLVVEYGDETYQYGGDEAEETFETVDISDYDPEMVIDLFADVENWLVYEGAGDEGSVDLEIPADYTQTYDGYYFVRTAGQLYTDDINIMYDNEVLGYLHYNIIDKSDLSSGESFTVNVTYKKYGIENHDKEFDINSDLQSTGHVVTETSREYSFPELGAYIDTREQFNDEYLEDIYTHIDYIANSETFNQVGYTFDFYVIEGIYLGQIKPTAVSTSASKVIVTAIVTCNDRQDLFTIHMYSLSKNSNGGLVIGGHSIKRDRFPDTEHDSYLDASFEYELVE